MERRMEIELPEEKNQKREREIQLVVNDFNVKESGLIECDYDNIASYRTAFNYYLSKFNEVQIVERKFSIKKDPELKGRYRVWRTQ